MRFLGSPEERVTLFTVMGFILLASVLRMKGEVSVK